ncbi:thioredoxin family protein [Chryseobacterium balustinum]|uniref:Peroxiredoxin n=1 Tax=Chryseobacterium balustinum TaxID=246 RepID=A0AAX2II02_9FLAO|nr:thioredoxin family protein [Chryseobacterium balustinum]AZB31309.1 thioredoxin family protein [Chryseobacterium balustinum]SKB37112.1 Peroxiredoxin [Chryseobacterium balustinum]SQA88035.1 Thiol-disulfide oxidoreductase resA [Chryseobacterium balustinum]
MKNIKTLVAAAIIGLSLLSFSAINKNNEEPKQKVSSSKGYEVGDTAADFKLKNIDGKMVSLSDFKTAKGFIVVFTCNHCPYAKKYEDRIVALDKKYKEAGYPVIAINPNDPNVQPEDGFQQMITRAKEKGFTFPYLVDEGQKVYPQYGATKTPHVFILQKEGSKNIVKYIGAIDNNYDDPNDVSEHYVQDAMDALLSGKPVANAKTVAIGCTIKVKK